MAWEARSGLKLYSTLLEFWALDRLNGLGSPFGFETPEPRESPQELEGLNGLGSPFGFETFETRAMTLRAGQWLNGLGSPFGFETFQ